MARPYQPSPQAIFFCAANTIAALVCLLAIILVLRLKLYKMVVYRLALYQVLAGLTFATIEASEIVFVNYSSDVSVYAKVCTAIGWVVVYTQWMKLLFTMWVTVHLFCFAVFYKNLKRFEALYVVTSLLVPALIASVPLTTRSYGLGPSGKCYIYINESNRPAFIERFALWDGPAMLTLLTASAAMVFVVVKLGRRVCGRDAREPLTDGGQHWKALKQLLPLAAFPLLFFVFTIPVVINDVYLSKWADANAGFAFSNAVFISLWSTSSGVTLIVHVMVANCFKRRRVSNVRFITLS
eukprot:Em0075g10a